MIFKEDQSRIRMGHGPENMALLRRLCVNLIKRDRASPVKVKLINAESHTRLCLRSQRKRKVGWINAEVAN